jgi:dolichol-phosphate mannosyltransferase
MNKDLVFTATYNEFSNVKKLLNKIENLNINVDILIVDDNSKDGTKEYIKNYKIKKKKFLFNYKRKEART